MFTSQGLIPYRLISRTIPSRECHGHSKRATSGKPATANVLSKVLAIHCLRAWRLLNLPQPLKVEQGSPHSRTSVSFGWIKLCYRFCSISSTTEVLGRTTIIAALLEAEVCKTEHVYLSEVPTHSKGQRWGYDLWAWLQLCDACRDTVSFYLVGSVVISLFRRIKSTLDTQSQKVELALFTSFIVLATWWLILTSSHDSW